MRKTAKGFFVLAVTMIFVLVVQPVVYAEAQALTTDEGLEYLKSVMDMIKVKYNGQVEDKQLIEGALRGMFDTMDPYTTYFSNEEADSFFGEMEGSYEGIGAALEKYGENVRIADVFSGSPAEKAGILANDIILDVDGVNVKGLEVAEVGNRIKGQAGTIVTVGIQREGVQEAIIFKVERGTVILDPGTYSIHGDVGYINLGIFNSAADDFITRALEQMDKNQITKLILDLRNNPGGEVGQAVEIAKKFVPKGVITKLDFKDGDKDDRVYYSTLEKNKYNLVVLVNENSASASEIVAGAIQDTKAGTLIGTRTFGKARVQSLIPMITPEAYKKYEKQLGVKLIDAYDLIEKYNVEPTDDEIMGWTKITTGEYFTPNGRMINGTGLVPDVEVKNLEYDGDVDIMSVRELTDYTDDSGMPAKNDILNGEMILKILGYGIATPDTNMDDETINALKVFQKDAKLEQTGEFDKVTRETLNTRLDKLFILIDRQYSEALQVLQDK